MRYLKPSILAGMFSGIFLLTTVAHAHFMWLNAHDYTPKANQTARFTVGWGHAFYNPVGDILEGSDMLGGISMIDLQGKTIAIKPVNSFQYESERQLPQGTYLALVNRKEGFSTKTVDGYKHQSRKGLKNVIHSRYTGMYGKAIINVGKPADTPSIFKPVGDALEIVPLVNPASLKVGDYFRFKLLYQGKPVAEYINATYVGFSQDNVWAYSTRTGSNGEGEVKMLQSGVWVLKANHKAPYPKPEEADEYSYTTSLTFEVR